MGIIVWEGIPRPVADQAYAVIKDKVSNYGQAMERHCEANTAKNCACQGVDPAKEGLSFSFGCSWNCYHNLCKFAKCTGKARKFHLSNRQQEQYLESQINELADICAPILKRVAPDCFFNMTAFNTPDMVCRLGTGPIEERPFSGTSTVVDFCAHAHHDFNNMNNGTTMVVTLLKPENREFGKPHTDRQLHVLPNYRIADVVTLLLKLFFRCH
jgi:methylcytosine dioxygenase